MVGTDGQRSDLNNGNRLAEPEGREVNNRALVRRLDHQCRAGNATGRPRVRVEEFHSLEAGIDNSFFDLELRNDSGVLVPVAGGGDAKRISCAGRPGADRRPLSVDSGRVFNNREVRESRWA